MELRLNVEELVELLVENISDIDLKNLVLLNSIIGMEIVNKIIEDEEDENDEADEGVEDENIEELFELFVNSLRK